MDFDSITAANQRNSPLLRLPAELRNKIYLYAFDDNHVWLAQNRRVLQGAYQPSPYPMSLAHSCTQCRHEALPYFWRSTVFHLIYNRISTFVHDKSQDLRDQIEVIHISYGVAWDLQVCLRGHKGAFIKVQKVIMAWGHSRNHTDEEVNEAVKDTFGEDAELADQKGYV